MTLNEKLILELKNKNADQLIKKWVPFMLKTKIQKKEMLKYLISIRDKTIERQMIILKANQIAHK